VAAAAAAAAAGRARPCAPAGGQCRPITFDDDGIHSAANGSTPPSNRTKKKSDSLSINIGVMMAGECPVVGAKFRFNQIIFRWFPRHQFHFFNLKQLDAIQNKNWICLEIQKSRASQHNDATFSLSL
jgi:hypothetical protein